MEEVEFQHLELFLKAPSKEVVVQQCQQAFLLRNSSKFPKDALLDLSNALSLDSVDLSLKLLNSLCAVIRNALFMSSNLDSAADVSQVFPGDFHKNLRDLLSKIIADKIPDWRKQCINNMVSLPQLVDFNWRVDIKTSADTLSRMSVPTCILQLQVDEKTAGQGFDGVNSTSVELSKETLDAMLDGLGKIRKQLSSVAEPAVIEQ